MPKNNLNFLENFRESIVKNRKITAGAKALYFYLVLTKDLEFNTRNKIAYDLNISNVTLGKYLKELSLNGYIKCSQRNKNGRFQSNRYTIEGGE